MFMRFVTTRIHKESQKPEGVFAAAWFKSNAEESMRHIWELVHFLRLHGHHVEVHKCRHLANISYADRYQVAAYPSERDGKTTVQ